MSVRAERRHATVVATAAGLAMGFAFGNLAAIAERSAETYGVPLATIGLMAMAQSITHTAAQIPAGRLADRIGGRHALLAGLLVIAGTNAIPLAAPDAWIPLLGRAFLGFGTALAFVGGAAYVRPFGAVAQGWFGGTGLGGVGLALAIMPALEGALGWRAPWLAATALAAAAALTLLGARGTAAHPPERQHPTSLQLSARRAARSEPGRGSLRVSLYRDPGLYRLAAMHMASMGLSIVVGNWVVTLLTRAGGHTDQVAGAAGSLILLLGVATRPLGGLALRRSPRTQRAVLAAGIVGSIAGTALLVVARPLPVAVVGAVLLGAAAGVSFAPVFTGAAHRRPDAPAAAVGLVNMLGNGVVVVGTPLLGLAFSLPGDGRVGFLALLAFWLLALGCLPRDGDLVASSTFTGLPSRTAPSKVPEGNA